MHSHTYARAHTHTHIKIQYVTNDTVHLYVNLLQQIVLAMVLLTTFDVYTSHQNREQTKNFN